MVYPFPDVLRVQPLTAIWALLQDDANAPKNAQWKATAVHWASIDYTKEKLSVGPGQHPMPDYMGDVVDPRTGKRIDSAVVEGRLLEISFQKAPFHTQAELTGDKLTFMIDPAAKSGDIPKYKAQPPQKAFLCGFSSHTPPSGKGNEGILPVFRDDFCSWGHMTLPNGQRFKIEPMYIIPHSGGVVDLTQPSTKYKFSQLTSPDAFKQSARKAATPVKELLSSDIVASDDTNDQPTVQPADTNGAQPTDINGVDHAEKDEISFPSNGEDTTKTSDDDVAFLTRPLEEADFGREVLDADELATKKGDDW